MPSTPSSPAHTRQTRRPAGLTSNHTSGAGKGIDTFGGPVIDPTENVLALVDAESKYQNDMRAAESRFQNAMREAESKRLDDLNMMQVRYEDRISNMLASQMKTDSALVSQQLDRLNTMQGDRLSALERFRYEVGGKSSVSDPAITDALTSLSSAVKDLKLASVKTEGRGLGRGEIVAWIFAGIGGLAAIVAILVNVTR